MCKTEWNKSNIINCNSSYIWERAFYSALFSFAMFSRTDQGENWLSVEGERGSNKDNVYVSFWFCLFSSTFFPSNNCSKSNRNAGKKKWLLVFSKHKAFNIICTWPLLLLFGSQVRKQIFLKERHKTKLARFAFFGPECVIYKSYCGQNKLWKTEWLPVV